MEACKSRKIACVLLYNYGSQKKGSGLVNIFACMLCSAPDFASSSLSEMGNTAGSVPVRYNDQIIRDLAKTSGLCESEVSQRSEDYYQGEESRGKK